MLDKMKGNFQELIHTGNHRNLMELSIWLLFSFIVIIHNRILGLCPPGEHGHDDVVQDLPQPPISSFIDFILMLEFA